MKVLTKERLIELFDNWATQAMRCYKWGDKEFYGELLPFRNTFELDSCNKHLLSEADYKVRFGGFLDQQLRGSGFAVHSELSDIYRKPRPRSNLRPDLTIHSIGDIRVFDTLTTLRKSVVAVIEFKGASFKKPKHDFRRGGIRRDIIKLSEDLHSDIPSSAIRCLVILDEACQLALRDFDDLKEDIARHKVTILSNNDDLRLLRDLVQ